METGNAKFDSLVNLIKDSYEKNTKIKNKINFQIEEINKTKTIINRFEECLKQQNEMLNKLLMEKLAIKNQKNNLIEELRESESSADEECENVYDNKDKDDKVDSLINLIKEANGKNSKLKKKINPQVEEINKTKTIINHHVECLNQQSEVLNKLIDEKLAIKNHKNDLIKDLSKLESSDDEKYENISDNQVKNHSFEQKNSLDIDTTNNYKNIHNFRQIGYDNWNMPFNLDSSTMIGNLLIPSFNQLIENDNFILSQNNENLRREFLIYSEDLKVPENETSIFTDEDFIKDYSPRLMLKLKNDIVINMDNVQKSLYVCCKKGILLKYDMQTNLWSIFYIGNTKNILQYTNFKNEHYLFCENEFVIFNELKTEVKEFKSNIISNLLIPRKKYPFFSITLENGEIWRYDLKNDKYKKTFSLRSKMKACINLPYNPSLFLTKDRKVFTTSNPNGKKVSELNGCVDIIASRGPFVVCYFGNGVCKIYDMAKNRLFELEISESIKLAKHSKSILAMLDVQNRLHLYTFTKKAFVYEKTQEIQIPTSKNVSAMSEVIDKQIFITVEHEIYLIKYN